MKPSIILNIFSFLLICTYFAIILLYFLSTQMFFPFWFSLGCFFIALYCLLKAFLFNHDSSFWLGLALGLSAAVGFLNYFGWISPTLTVFYYFLCPALSSVLCAIIYKKKQHYKISFILILEDFWILLYSKNIISLIWLIAFTVLTILICFRGIYVLARKRRIQQKTSEYQN